MNKSLAFHLTVAATDRFYTVGDKRGAAAQSLASKFAVVQGPSCLLPHFQCKHSDRSPLCNSDQTPDSQNGTMQTVEREIVRVSQARLLPGEQYVDCKAFEVVTRLLRA